ncbi:hypothetical protein [Novosphingobium sp. KACC 22771]|uniref:hypothetical protein n=1 Tax=Novosphingobium sp. KACC 22771 TaxID=3025670 RepID=UPI002365C62F|nr:hypothetical protein [Novosphingobium sp. KACC 22771]WDF72617.1 hypothetical protein PQ467_00820 [Novosphingobium sp. KACC 22771]
MRGDIRDFFKRVALAYGLVALLLLLTNAGAIAAGHFPDPDDALRLVELRDWLGGQGWFDVTQHRIDPAHGGVAMHWSRIVDVPLALVVLALRPVLGGDGAEMAAMLIVPLLTLAMVMVLAARVAWERLGAEATTLSCLTLAMSVPVVTQIRPMRIDHHGWQVAAAMLALQGLMTRHARIGGWISGAALAIGLSISLEGLPLTAVFGALGAWRWLRGGETRDWLAHFAAALAAVSLACFAATRWGDWAQHCDAIAPVHLAMFVWAALVLRLWRGPALAGLAIAGAGALALYLGLAPQCRGGSFNMLDPLVQRLWYQQVAEGLPLWRQDWATALQTVVPPLFALFACAGLMRRSTGEERVWWQEYTLILGGALAVAVLVTRAGAVAGAFSAVPLAWLVGEWLVAARQGRPIAALGIVAAMVPSAPITIWAMMPHKASAPAALTAQRVSACEARRHAAVLNTLPQGTILAPLDIGPDILLGSRDSVLATGHHRGARGMHDAIAAFVAAPDAARAIIRANHIAYVALCPDLGEPQIYAREAPHGLAAQLLAGRAPSWLAPVAADGLQVWRVI